MLFAGFVYYMLTIIYLSMFIMII